MLLLNQIEVISHPFDDFHRIYFNDFVLNECDHSVYEDKSVNAINYKINCTKDEEPIKSENNDAKCDDASVLNACEDASVLNTCEVKENGDNRKSTLRRAKSVQESAGENNNKSKNKKVVRFADALGLDLVKIKLIKNPDRPPRVPKHILRLFRQSSKSNDENNDEDDDEESNEEDDEDHEWFYNDKNPFMNKINENSYINSIIANKYNSNSSSKIIRTINGASTSIYAPRKSNRLNEDSFKVNNCEHSLKWKQCFEQPGIMPCFFKNLNEKKISLETVHMKSHLISGVVRVSNICFNKVVKIRYTTDKWKTHSDINAAYVNNSCDGLTDRFSFNLNLENNLSKFFNNSQNFYNTFHIEFAIAYETDFNNSSLFWDNNSGSNYKFEVCMKKFKFKC